MVTSEQLADSYLKMHQIRAFEEKVAYFFSRGMIHGTTHLYIGEEAVAAGACAALAEQDLITSTHRGHGHCIAKGIELPRMMAELLGKASGYCKGKGGSMHIADLTRGNLGANGIVGGGIPIATGAGLTVKMKKTDQVVVCFFGDGALNQGVFHESVNMASIWNLPVIYICENNQYGMSMSRKKSMNIDDLAVRADSYGIPGKTIDGNDFFAVYNAVLEAKAHAQTQGPYFIAAETYRYQGHSKSDANRYRTKEEIAEWKLKDPLPRMAKAMVDQYDFSQEQVEAIVRQAREEIEEAVAWASNEPYPEMTEIADDVFA